MARDYKHRVQSGSYSAQRSRRHKKQRPGMGRRWLLIGLLLVVFVVFLNMVRSMVAELMDGKPQAEAEHSVIQQIAVAPPAASSVPALTPVAPAAAEPEKKPEPTPAVAVEQEPEPAPEEPRYDFYTILPQAETVVPDYEMQSRVREELVGKTKSARYVMQAGSFRESAEAERHKAKLAALGIEARVEKAKVGNVIWHRVKIGPYDNPSSVSTIKELLQKNGIGVIVTEQGQ